MCELVVKFCSCVLIVNMMLVCVVVWFVVGEFVMLIELRFSG